MRCDDAVLANGKPCKREIIEHSGGACVLCVVNGKIPLVRQFRYAYGEELLELPAGKMEKGEDPLFCAMRELSEETGLVAERLELLHEIYPTPGYTDEKIYIYLARSVKEGAAHLDEGEILNVEWIDVEQALEMAACGKIKDSKTIVGLYRYRLMNISS